MQVGRQFLDVACQHCEIDDADRGEFTLALDRDQRRVEADDALFQATTQRAYRLAVIGKLAKYFQENAADITYAVEIALEMRRWRLRPFSAGRGYCNQVTGQVATVDCRNVAGAESVQGVGIIPVVEVATILLHSFNGGDRLFHALDGLLEAQPAEMPGGHDREEVDADIRRRGPVRDDGLGRFLEIVGRQIVVADRREGLVVAPGAARDLAQFAGNVFGHFQAVFRLGRLADIPCEERGEDPEKGEGKADQITVSIGQCSNANRQNGQDRGMAHVVIVGSDRALGRRLHARSRAPFEEQFAAHQHAVERSNDGVGHHTGIVGDKHDAQRHLGIDRTDFRPQRLEMGGRDDVGLTRHDAREERDRRGDKKTENQQQLPDGGADRFHRGPAENRGGIPCDRGQRAAQIVDHFPAAKAGNAAAGVADIGNELPIAAGPAMLARNFHLVACRKVLDQFDIGDEGAAGERAFQQIVAEDAVFVDPALDRGLEGINVVKPLAGEGALAGDVLIDVGYGEDVGIQAAVHREDALENRCVLAGCQRRRDAGLQHAVAADHATRFFVMHRTVDRMVHLSDELGDGVTHQACVGVERHHVANILRHGVGARQIGRVAVAAQQQVQLVQLAAFSFPAHPAAFSFVVEAAAMHEIEACLASEVVASVEMGYLALGVFENLQVGRGFLRVAVLPVAEQGEVDLAVRIGQIVNFQIADEFIDIVALGDHAGHDDEGARLLRDAFLELVAGQAERFDEERHERVEQASRPLRYRQGNQDQQNQDQRGRQSCLVEEVADDSERRDRQRDHGYGDREPVQPLDEVGDDTGQGLAVANGVLELGTAAADKIAPDVKPAVRARCLSCHIDRRLGDLDLGQVASARQPFDRVSVGVARAEVELAVVGMLAKDPVDMADILNPDRPLLVVDLAQAANDVAHRHIAGGKPVVLCVHRFFGGPTGSLQAAFQPFHRETRVLRTIAQAIEELGRKRVVVGELFDLSEIGRRCDGIVQADDLVGHFIGAAAHPSRTIDAGCDAAKVFDQHEAYDRRQSPELTDLQRLMLLVSLDQRRHAFLADGGVGMGNVEPGERHGPRNLALADLHRR